jgi:hypothetical protein
MILDKYQIRPHPIQTAMGFIFIFLIFALLAGLND